MVSWISIALSGLAITVSCVTAWLTLLRRGTIRMTQPTQIFLGPDALRGGPLGPPKVFLRTLLYCTSKRGQIVENMFVRLRRGQTAQTFNIWIYGDNSLERGSGLYVGESGVVCNHNFLVPNDGTQFDFLPGDYYLEVFVSLVSRRSPNLLSQLHLALTDAESSAIREGKAGVVFDWGPDSGKYHSRISFRSESELDMLSDNALHPAGAASVESASK